MKSLLLTRTSSRFSLRRLSSSANRTTEEDIIHARRTVSHLFDRRQDYFLFNLCSPDPERDYYEIAVESNLDIMGVGEHSILWSTVVSEYSDSCILMGSKKSFEFLFKTPCLF